MGRRKNGTANGHVGGHSDHESSDLTETQRSNVRLREERINEACERLYQLDKKIKKIIDAEVKDFRGDKADIKSALSEDFGITAEVINARYHAYRVERKAHDNGDKIMLDTIREMFRALPVGKIVDLSDAAGADDDNEEITDTLDTAKKKGTAAGAEGKNKDTNPYPAGSQHHRYWDQNWTAAQGALADQIKKGGGQTAAPH